jgi:hypothetical protein
MPDEIDAAHFGEVVVDVLGIDISEAAVLAKLVLS